jgi:uncharacterized protein
MNMFQNTPLNNLGKVLGAFLLTAVVLGTGLLVFKVVGPIPLSITSTVTQKQMTFDVTGKSEIVTVPDEAQVSVGIESNASSVASAQNQTNIIINNITDAMDKLGVDKKDIQTQNYSVYPQYDYNEPGRPRITGYQVTTNLRITVRDFEKLNEVIDSSTSLGANQVGGINFSMSDEKRDELTKQARKEAIEDAQEQAQELAGLAGIKLGKVINVYESPMYEPPMYYGGEARMDLAVETKSAEPTQIQPGSTDFNYSVTLSYETL